MSIESIECVRAERDATVRAIVMDLAFDGEFYSGDVWREWYDSSEDRPEYRFTKRQGMSVIQPLLRAIVAEGLLHSRPVPPEEHGGSTMLRRYYTSRR